MAQLGERSKDIIKHNFYKWMEQVSDISDIIKGLNDDLSNTD
ncbi:MAG: hypothetical protein VZS44_07865 [Bacilli bacterium]|nr:hypothetical protein [Bacilli bacterium]